jgi:drug/metabolite transporter (DMT)-like permease
VRNVFIGMSRRHLGMLVALSAIWGASFMFIKVALRDLDPIAVVWLRITLAAVVLVPAALAVLGRPALLELLRRSRHLAVMAVFNSALPFLLLSWAETRIDSGLAALLQAAAPLFTALILVRVGSDRVTGLRLLGVVVGFVGVALLVGVDGVRVDVIAALAVVFTGFCYAASGVYGGLHLRGVHPLVIGSGSMVIASLVTAPFALFSLPESVPGWKEVGSILTLGLVGTGIAYMLFFAILTGAGASRSILVTYLVPAAALAYGAVLLGEPVTATAVAGLALILTGVALGTRRVPSPA